MLKYTVFGATIDDTVLADKPLGALDFPAADLTDAGVDGVDLGTIAPDTKLPVVTGVPSNYNGPPRAIGVHMTATVDDACGTSDVVWKFSDGGTEYGPDAPSRPSPTTGTTPATSRRPTSVATRR